MNNLKISFELAETDVETLHEFDLGHMSFECGGIKITSSNKIPSQAMMIFTSISHLMYVIRQLYSSEKVLQVNFGADDSSFVIKLKKLDANQIKISDKYGECIVTSKIAFINGVWREVKYMCDSYFNKLQGSGAAIEDIESELRIFRNTFHKDLKTVNFC